MIHTEKAGTSLIKKMDAYGGEWHSGWSNGKIIEGVQVKSAEDCIPVSDSAFNTL